MIEHRWLLALVALTTLVASACDRLAAREPLEAPGIAAQALPRGPTVGLELVADGLVAPVQVASPDDGSGRLFIVDQEGSIRVVAADGSLVSEPFLDVGPRMVSLSPAFDERGLLGLALHPDFAQNGRFFVHYSAPLRPGAPEGFNHTSHVAEFGVTEDDPDSADDDSERIVLQVDQPQANHNGGALAFGPDGLLYVSLGDGGGANDVGPGHTSGLGNGQDATNLLGSILRIDVDGGGPYAIPSDNPFVGTTGRDEIYAYGFRNPYRFSFDAEHGLLAADAGQNLWEEVSLVERGGNYGWNVKEGSHCFDPYDAFASPPDCPDLGPLFGDALIDPVIEYPNIRHPELDGVGLAVIGGHVYRGAALPQLRGTYVFADWSRDFAEPDGTLLVARPRKERPWKVEELRIAGRDRGRLGHYVLSVGEDADGEIYVLTSDGTGPTGVTGRVYRLVRPHAR